MLEPTQISKVGLPKSVLPEPKQVTRIQGVPFDEFQKQEEKEKARLYEVDPEDEEKFLEDENDLNTLRLDNKDLREGRRPPERVTIWKFILTAMALALGLLKLFGVI